MRAQGLERILFVVDSKSKTTFYEQIQCAATIIDVAIRQMPSIQVEWNNTYDRFGFWIFCSKFPAGTAGSSQDYIDSKMDRGHLSRVSRLRCECMRNNPMHCYWLNDIGLCVISTVDSKEMSPVSRRISQPILLNIILPSNLAMKRHTKIAFDSKDTIDSIGYRTKR